MEKPVVENPEFEDYLVSLGIRKGAIPAHRSNMIAAMYRTATIYADGFGLPVFPIAKLNHGWIGWLGHVPDLQVSEGWPFVSLMTRHSRRSYTETVMSGKKKVERLTEADVIEVRMPFRSNEVANTLRVCCRYRGEQRMALIEGFCAATNRTDSASLMTLTKDLVRAESIFTKTVKSSDYQKQARWRKLAIDLGL
jgi:hypothetical protein